MPTDLPPLDRICPTCLLVRSAVSRLEHDSAAGQLRCTSMVCAAQFTEGYIQRTLNMTDRMVQALGFATTLQDNAREIDRLRYQLERARERPAVVRPAAPKLKPKPKPRPRRVSLEDRE